MPARRPNHRLPITLAGALTLVVAVSACTMGHDSGGSTPSSGTGSSSSSASSSSTPQLTATQAFSKMQGSVRSATSTSVEAHGLMQGQQSTLTLSGDLDNDPTKTHAAMGKNGTADIIVIGQNVYVKGDTSYWEKAASASATVAGHLSGKWLKASKKQFASDTASIAPKSLTSEVTDDNGTLATKFQSSSATLTKTTYEKQAAYLLTGDDGKTKVWCSADGKYTLFKIEQPDNPDDFTSATFSDWNVKPAITAPQGAITLPNKKGSGSGSTGGGGTLT